MKTRKVVIGRRAGQGMIEYIIIVLIVAVACLVVVGVFGTNVRSIYHTANASLKAGQAQDSNFHSTDVSGNITINNLNGD
ncbi:MAG: hypothetical protein EOM20_16355 [Spartobacteria bacterium]|nr:hypothetical protein [Spartobacteria bacterium]